MNYEKPKSLLKLNASVHYDSIKAKMVVKAEETLLEADIIDRNTNSQGHTRQDLKCDALRISNLIPPEINTRKRI